MLHRSLRSPFFTVSLALLLAFAATPVLAQTEEEAEGEVEREEAETRYDANLDQAARRVFLSARQAFAAGDYETALERFRQAYNLSPRPTLLYNIAATLDRLRRDEEAVEALKAYIEAAPDAEDRTEIEARIRVLEEAIARREAEREPEPTETETETEPEVTEPEAPTEPAITEPPPEESSGLHPAIVLAVGGATVVVGGLLVWSGLNTLSRNDDYESYVTQPGATLAEGERLLADVESAEKRTNILMGVTIGLGAAAAVLAIFTDWGGSSDEDEPDDGSITVGGAAGPDGGMIGLRGTF